MSLRKRKGILMILLVAIMLVVTACSSDLTTSDPQSVKTNDENKTDNESNKEETGGTLKIALDASPPSLINQLVQPPQLEISQDSFMKALL